MEDNFQALSIEELKEIDQASLQEGIQRSLVEFQCYLGVTSSTQPEHATQGKVRLLYMNLLFVKILSKSQP